MLIGLGERRRLAYDADDTVVLYASTGTPLTTLEKQKINNEADDALTAGADKIVFLLRPGWALQGIYLACNGAGLAGTELVEYSTDTTTGLDGTWTDMAGSWPGTIPSRNNVTVHADFAGNIWETNVDHAVRVRYGSAGAAAVAAIHLYGYQSGSAGRDVLDINTNSAASPDDPYFDLLWETRAQSAIEGIQGPLDGDDTYLVTSCYVFSESPSHTAHGVTVSIEALTDSGAPSNAAQYLLSHDGAVWVDALTFPDIGPLAKSADFYVRRYTPHDAVAGTWGARLVADCSGMS